MSKVRTALISVSDKTDLIPFAKGLKSLGVKIISTGGTAKELKRARVKCVDISEVTGFPEMLDGRVKTLHPKVHGGLLAIRSSKEHMKIIKKHGIELIDMVVVNLYPFEKTVANPKVKFEEAIENIDIGGPSMIRSAAKNNESVAVVTTPCQYKMVLAEMKKSKGILSHATKQMLAREAFKLTAKYDSAIFSYLSSVNKNVLPGMPAEINMCLDKVQELRYGENPHQKAAFYKEPGFKGGLADLKQLHGKELSYNNIYDIDAAWSLVNYFVQPTVAIIKHTNPCGVGQADKIANAYKKAYACDQVSAYGSVIGVNRPVDEEFAKALGGLFVEVIAAPSFDKGALKILTKRQNIRLLEMGKYDVASSGKGFDYKRVRGGFLVQDPDNAELTMSDIKVVSKRQPTMSELEDLFFAWGVVKFVKSNAIVIAKGKETLGIGAGQTNRVGSVEIALKNAGVLTKGAVLASDAFFPFRDSIDLAHKAGISAVMETGGSIRDAEVIQAANESNIALIFTGRRHFKH